MTRLIFPTCVLACTLIVVMLGESVASSWHALPVEKGELMQKFRATIIALPIFLIVSGCSSNNQTVQQRQACAVGDQHPWCMQMAQTKPLGAAPYGLESTGPTNPEMRDDNTPYPRNPALSLAGGFHF